MGHVGKIARGATRIYNPVTGTWTKTTPVPFSVMSEKALAEYNKDLAKTAMDYANRETNTIPVGSVALKTKDYLTASSTDSGSATGAAEKDYNLIEYNILTGILTFIGNEKTIKMKAGDTITLDGLGKYLSGDYYVQDVTRVINESGYSHTATLIKTDFGDTLKTSSKNDVKNETSTTDSTKSDGNGRVHILKKGECLWGLAVKYYNDGSKYKSIASANNIPPEQYTKLQIGRKIVIP